MPEAEPRETSTRSTTEVLVVSVAMVFFALFVHSGLPWIALSVAGLLVTGATIGSTLRHSSRPAELVGFALPLHSLFFLLVGGVIGTGGGMMHRFSLGLPVLPAGGIEGFAVVACLIGATEELFYRGWVQGRAMALGSPAAVVLAALAHTAYKTALFAWPITPTATDFTGLAVVTFIGGILLGLLRQYSKSVLPSVFAHAVFDFVVYGALSYAPWWVWR